MQTIKPAIHIFTPGPIGGAERIIIAGLIELNRQGLSSELLIIKEERVPQVTEAFIDLVKKTNIKYSVISSRKIFDPALLKELKGKLRTLKPLIIHTHGFKATFYASLVKPASSKFVVTHHGTTAHTLKVRMYEKLERVVMKRADAVIAVSKKMKSDLIQHEVPSSSIEVIENFLALTPTLRHKTNVIPHFIFVGRLSPEKGCKFLIEGVSLLPKDLDIRITVVGDGIESQLLKSMVREKNLQEKVKFLGFQANIIPILEQADAFIMPSMMEGQPLALIEACCMGIPALVSDVGGLPELIENQRNGLLFPPGEPESIKNSILEFLMNQNDYILEAENRRNYFIQRFSPAKWGESIISLYQRLVNQS